MVKKAASWLFLAVLTLCLVLISPRAVTQETAASLGAPVQLNSETLFVIHVPIGSFSAGDRAQAVTQRLEKVAADYSVEVQTLKVTNEAAVSSITIGSRALITITDEDAKAADADRKTLAQQYLAQVRDAINTYRRTRQPDYLLRQGLYAAGATLGLFLVLFLIQKAFPRLLRQLEAWRSTRIPALRIQNLELLPSERITDILVGLSKLLRLLLVGVLLYLYVPLVLSFFPWTRGLGQRWLNYLGTTLNQAGKAIGDYIPNLLIILLIAVVTFYVLRFLKLIFAEIRRGNLKFSWFYQEWATPTYKLTAFLVIALAAVMAFPFLPGFQSPAFQGVSLFIGVLFSLGSTAAIANMVAGIILIYTRAFQLGDRVKIGETAGDIEEKTLLVTRIRTPKNVIVTLPNSTVLGSNVINYSASMRDTQRPLLLHTTITLGYDVPWRKVHEVLAAAAVATPDILSDPAPFVLQTSLDDFYVSYELNAFTLEANRMPKTYSVLHQNIQDGCNSADIEILSPHYSALRDGHQSTIPADYLPADYRAPGFRMSPPDRPWPAVPPDSNPASHA